MNTLKNLDLNLLIVFEAIFSCGNISQAAKKLGMSQPTISNALARLRDALDDPLFVRAGRGVQPTPKAVSMIGPIREALQMIEGGVSGDEGFDPITSSRHFRVVIMDPLEPIILPPILNQLQAHKSVTIENLGFATTAINDSLNDGSLDLVIANFMAESQDTTCLPLAPAHLSVVVRKGHPQVEGQLTLELFKKLGHIALVPQMRSLSRIEEALRNQDFKRHVVYSVTKFWSFPHILASTDLIGIIPTSFAKVIALTYPIDIHPMPFEIPQEQFYMTWKTSRSNDPAHQWLRDQIIAALRAFKREQMGS